jgi:hypothetical protein
MEEWPRWDKSRLEYRPARGYDGLLTPRRLMRSRCAGTNHRTLCGRRAARDGLWKSV